MKNFVSLNKNRDFIRAYKKGRSAVTPCLALYFRPNNLRTVRLGITVSKKVGKAVQRNRAKRILRAGFMLLLPQLKTGCDFVLVARGRTPYKKTQDIYSALYGAAVQNNLLI